MADIRTMRRMLQPVRKAGEVPLVLKLFACLCLMYCVRHVDGACPPGPQVRADIGITIIKELRVEGWSLQSITVVYFAKKPWQVQCCGICAKEQSVVIEKS